MAKDKNTETVRATLYFFTKGATLASGSIACWEEGTVGLTANPAKGIKTGTLVENFKNIDEIPAAIRRSLNKARVVTVRRK